MIRLARLLEYLLIFIAVIGVAPLYPHLELLPQIMLPVATVAGIYINRRQLPVPGKLFTIISFIFFFLYAIRFNKENVVVPAANLLAIFLAVRLASERTGRAYMQTCALALFCLAASTLFSLSPFFLFALLLLMALIAATLVLLTFYESDPSMALNLDEFVKLGKVVLATAVAGIPLMLLFFIILPRTQFPLWNAFVGGGAATTGISDRVEPGRSPVVDESHSAAFRAVSPQLDPQQLYWRSIVFNRYSGNAWVRQPLPAQEEVILPKSRLIQQTIFPEIGKTATLPTLNIPVRIFGIRSSITGDLVVTSSSVKRVKYQTASAVTDTIKLKRSIDREFYLRLPEKLPPRLANRAREIGKRGRTDRERLSLAQEFFVSQKIAYSTKNLPTGNDSIDIFLFDVKQGHCEFFASSFALLMRAAGVPSRIVAGHYGGFYNELGGYYVVTDDLAHAWTEVFLEDAGWVTVDPTRWAIGFAELGNLRTQSFVRRLSTAIDTFNYYWNLAVIAYDLDRQFQLANKAGERLQQITVPSNLRRILLWSLLISATAGLLFFILRFKRFTPEERLIRRFYQLSNDVKPGTGLFELASGLNDPRAVRFASIYCGAVFRDRSPTKCELNELSSILKELRKERRKSQ